MLLCPYRDSLRVHSLLFLYESWLTLISKVAIDGACDPGKLTYLVFQVALEPASLLIIHL